MPVRQVLARATQHESHLSQVRDELDDETSMTDLAPVDHELLSKIRVLLFELDFHLRMAAARGIILTPDLVERETGPLNVRPYTSMVIPEVE